MRHRRRRRQTPIRDEAASSELAPPVTAERETISLTLRLAVLIRDGHRCRLCGVTAREVRLEIDHKVPVVLGGTSAPDNLLTLCRPCNRGKGGRRLPAATEAFLAQGAREIEWPASAGEGASASPGEPLVGRSSPIERIWATYTNGGTDAGDRQAVAQWIADQGLIVGVGRTPLAVLHERFTAWAQDVGLRAMSHIAFSRALSARRVVKRRGSAGFFFEITAPPAPAVEEPHGRSSESAGL